MHLNADMAMLDPQLWSGDVWLRADSERPELLFCWLDKLKHDIFGRARFEISASGGSDGL